MSALQALAAELAPLVADLLEPRKALYSVKEAAEYLGCSTGMIRNMVALGKLEAVKLGSRTMIQYESLRRASKGQA